MVYANVRTQYENVCVAVYVNTRIMIETVWAWQS